MDPNIVDINGGKYLKEKFLGKGAYGQVDMVRGVCIIPKLQGHQSICTTGPAYALKTINPILLFEKAMDEVNILKSSCHPHIIRLFDAVAQPSSVLILMEYCEGGNLNSRLERTSDADTNLRWMKELADAMCFLHSKGIVHRDLKPENVLLTANDSIKLGDFGLARVAPLSFFMNTAYMATFAGTIHCMAPEVFDKRYTGKADIFSLGLIFYVILTRSFIVDMYGQKYFRAFVIVNGQMGLGEAMKVDPRYMVTGLDQLPFSMGNLIRPMLDYNPHKRPSAQNVLQFVGFVLHQRQTVMRPWNNFFY